MKRLIFFALIAVWASMALAHDFEVGGIYYKKNSDGTSVSVSYKGTSYNQYSDEYSGSVNIPPSVTSSGVTYSVTSTGLYAFYGCSRLTSVTIPNFVTSIGERAFLACSGLKSVTIGNTVTTIGDSAFSGCSGLTKVTIPNSVTSIGQYAFDGCSGLTSVTIPSSVKSIGGGAFSGCSGLKSITIPNSVTSIGSYAFSGCRGLTSVTIPNSVTSLGNFAFRGCSGLTSVTIPNSVKSIGESAFNGCSGLTSVTIGNSVTSIGGDAFKGCSGLKTVNWNAKNYLDFSKDSTPFHHYYYLGSSDNYTLTGITTFNFGNEVKKIPAYLCYQLSGLTSVTIPNSVTSIGKYAFQYCSRLTSVTIPNSVTSIGWGAFDYCNLTSVTIPKSVSNIGSAFWGCGLKAVIWNAKNCYCSSSPFSGNNGITSFTFGNEVEKIPSYLCSGLSGLKSVTIPNTVTTIGDSAFSGCSGLTSVTIPNTVTSLGEEAFIDCSGLKTVNWNAKNSSDCKSAPFYGSNGIVSFNFGDEVEKIPAFLCYGLSGLTSVTIPSSVKSIGAYAFSDTPWYNNKPDGIVYINNIAYSYKGTMPSNTSIAIKEGIVSISPSCFSGCSGLTSVTIPNSVTSIGSYAFYSCSGLKTVNWNAKNCTDCKSSPFYELTGITTFNFGDEVEKIPAFLCYELSGLTTITFPNSVKTIGERAFYGCTGLISIINPYNIKTISRDAFHNTKWFDNQSYGNLVYIGNVAYCFKGQYSPPQSMAIREGTVSISPYCFYGVSVGYSGIQTTLLDIPNSVEIIGEYAFCNSYMFFRTLKVGASVTEIGKEALRYGGLTNTLIWNAKNCNSNGGLITKNINLVSIGNGVEVLPNGFVEGSQITDVTIPGSVKTIGDNAFASCSKLSTVTNYALTPQSINESVFQNVDVSFCTLYVPAESNSLYTSANVWKDFFIQNAGVEGVEVDKSTKEIEGYYNLQGIRLNEPIRGQVNIVRYSDGSAEKIVAK